MQIQWYAHACFRIASGDFSIVTDPYTPHKAGFRDIADGADLVVRSSDDDSAHCNAAMFPGSDVLTMTHAPAEGTVWRGVRFTPIPARESLIHKVEPGDNALYRFVLEGVDVIHFGDVGNPLEDWQLEKMKGVDVALVPTGGPPTMELSDLHQALAVIQPKVIIPMHYALPNCKFPAMQEVTAFTGGYASDRVREFKDNRVEITPAALPASPQIWVLHATHTT